MTVVRFGEEGGETHRKCGECGLCCKLLPMKAAPTTPSERWPLAMAAGIVQAGAIPEFDKPANVRCPHQSHSKGCKVYSRRPASCQMWSCRWLAADDTDDLSRPDRSHVVIDLMPDYVTTVDNETGERNQIEVVQVWCDPHHPDAWRAPSLMAYFERRGRDGIAAIIRYSNSQAFTLIPPAMASDKSWHEIRDGNKEPEHTPEDFLKFVGG